MSNLDRKTRLSNKESLLEKYKSIYDDMVIEGLIPPQSVQYRPEFFTVGTDTREFLYCAMCARPVPGRLDQHLRSKKCPARNLSEERRKALHCYGKAVSSYASRACIDLAELPQPQNRGEYECMDQMLSKLREGGVAVKGKLVLPADMSLLHQIKKMRREVRSVLHSQEELLMAAGSPAPAERKHTGGKGGRK